MSITSIVKGSLLAAALAGAFVLSACTPAEQAQLQGLLQNVDSVNGTITVVDKDGQTHVIKIQSGSQVQTQSGSSSLEALAPGAEVRIELERRGSDDARRVEANIARVEGTISQSNSATGNITVTPERGGAPVALRVTANTTIKLREGGTGNFSSLTIGTPVDVKYTADTKTALKISIDEKETAEIEGNVTAISGNSTTIQTEKGRTVTLTIASTTLIRSRGSAGSIADLKVGLKVNAKFDPFTKTATRIEIQGNNGGRDDNDENEDENEVETPPSIPHTIQGRSDCLACHQTGIGGADRVPADHTGRPSTSCLSCHQPRP